MKMKGQGIVSVAILVALTLTPRLFAIEGLKIQAQCPNIVLTWPSVTGETYIVRYRPSLDNGTAWTVLTNSLPARTGTNTTLFIHLNQISCTNSGGGGGGGGQGDPPPPPTMASLQSEPLVVPADGSGSAVPIMLFPPGFDLTGFLILDPTSDQWMNGAGHLIVPPSQSAAVQLGGAQPLGPGSGGVNAGFYEVVRVGPHFFGLTNGMVLSGVVSLPMEFGNTNASARLDSLFLFATNGGPVPNGFTFPIIPSDITYGMTSRWDTTVVPNGTYTFGVGAYLNDYLYGQYGTTMTEYDDKAVTVQVLNPISWDGYGVGGDAFYVGAKTIYPNGKWQLKIYDNLNHLLATLPSTTQQGPIDADGYCAWPDPNNPNQPDPNAQFPGFSLSNLQGNGRRLPYPSYMLAMSIWPFGGGSSKSSTNIVAIEAAWPEWPSTTVVAYQQLFAFASPAYDEEMAMVQAVAAAQNIYHPLVGVPLFNNIDVPFEITMGSGWSSVTNALATAGTRDFFWFGHGNPKSLGGGGLPATTVATLLGNNAVTTNSHPYRFVFLDGCLTANGTFPQAFGIPKIENMIGTDFPDKRGIRQRAFMGWDQTKIVGALGAYWNAKHSSLISGFYINWQIRDRNTGYGQYGVKDAFGYAAATNSMSSGMHIYGSKDLIIDF